MTTERCILLSLLVLLTAGASSSCRDTPLAVNVRANNKTPVANAGENQMLDFDGAPVTVTLDASLSTDSDGTIVEYRWLSGLDVDGGVIGRGGIDPDDEVSPTLTLGAGTWEFTLFVIDNEGEVSSPDTVTIQVGSALPPKVAACVETAAPSIADDCKLCVCQIDDMCRELFTPCDDACWTFYTCVENNCRDITSQVPVDINAARDCTVANCSDLFAGVGPWIPLEMCVRNEACATMCSDSVQGVPF
jgi:hypothetical protein